VDKYRILACDKDSNKDEGRAELSAALQQMLQRSKPRNMHLYCLHKEITYRATVTASDIASKLDNGAFPPPHHHQITARCCFFTPIFGPERSSKQGN
jgi:hypothetical protein